MSPSLAWQDPVFRTYVCILLGLLAGTGIVLALLQFGAGKNLGSVWSTYRSWLVMGPLAGLVIFAGRVPFIIGVALVALAAAREFLVVSELNRDRLMSAVIYLGILSMALLPFERFAAAPPVVPLLFITLILLVPILRNRASGGLRAISLGILSFIYLGWMFGHLGFLANGGNPYGSLCFLLLATEVNDVAAFTCGRIFGRHPLRSEISPRKTWEGAAGGLAVSLLLPWLLRFSFPTFGALQLIATGLLVALGGTAGDLSVSLLKRELGTKDFGATIPGHGGVLDRIDSLIFTAPLFYHLVK